MGPKKRRHSEAHEARLLLAQIRISWERQLQLEARKRNERFGVDERSCREAGINSYVSQGYLRSNAS